MVQAQIEKWRDYFLRFSHLGQRRNSRISWVASLAEWEGAIFSPAKRDSRQQPYPTKRRPLSRVFQLCSAAWWAREHSTPAAKERFMCKNLSGPDEKETSSSFSSADPRSRPQVTDPFIFCRLERVVTAGFMRGKVRNATRLPQYEVTTTVTKSHQMLNTKRPLLAVGRWTAPRKFHKNSCNIFSLLLSIFYDKC